MDDGGGSGDVVLPQGIVIPERELVFEFSRSGGPGGQNVNKVETRVTLRFDVLQAASLDERTRGRLLERLGPRLTAAGELILHSSEHRERSRNRAAVVGRFRNLLVEALKIPKRRVPTRPSRGAVERRIGAAKRRGELKRLRRKPPSDD